MKRLAFLVLGAALLGTATGCLKFEEELTILPDGSGKLVYRFAMNPELSKMGGAEEKDPLEEFMSSDPAEFENNAAGIVAMARPERIEIGGWKGLKLTLYFEDINAMKLGDGEKKTAFSFKKEGDGFALEVIDRQFEGKPEESETSEEMKKRMEEMFKKMMAGFDYKATVKLPGAVKTMAGYTMKEGRTASMAVGEKDIQAQQDMKKLSSRKAACGPSEVTDSETAAFRKELAAAKEEWPKLKAEIKANAEKKKSEPEKKDDK